MYKGSCLCGQIRFEIHGGISSVIYCHCSQCRKAQGSAFGANGFVASDEFVITTGGELLKSYESTPGKERCFCSHCGSPILSRRLNDLSRVRVRLGALEGDITEKPEGHLFYGSKANWCELDDDLPKYEGYEPSR